jgi:hypothetical protein
MCRAIARFSGAESGWSVINAMMSSESVGMPHNAVTRHGSVIAARDARFRVDPRAEDSAYKSIARVSTAFWRSAGTQRHRRLPAGRRRRRCDAPLTEGRGAFGASRFTWQQ